MSKPIPRANYKPNYADEVEAALDAIMSALWPNAELGWNVWSSYAAAGEWI